MLYSSRPIQTVCIRKDEVFCSKCVDYGTINLACWKVLLVPRIRIQRIISWGPWRARKIYEIYVSCSIINLRSTIEYVSIMHMLVKVHIIIRNKKVMRLDLFSHLCFHCIGVCYKGSTNTLIRYQYFYQIERLNRALWYIVCKGCMPGNCLENIWLSALCVAQ